MGTIQVDTQDTTLSIKDNDATAFKISNGADIMVFDTSNGAEVLDINVAELDVTGTTFDINYPTVDVATQATVLNILDNDGSAFKINNGADIMVFDTTDNTEILDINVAELDVTG